MHIKIGVACLLAVASLTTSAFGQLPLTACPLPKNRESTSLAEFASAIPLTGNNLAYTASKYNDFAAAMILHRSGDAAAGRERVVLLAKNTADIGKTIPAARFWSMTPAQKRTGLFMRALPRLKKIFAAEGVPEHLVWLAEVESSFDQNALSRTGAVGLFQLMPDTAVRFGLQLKPLDERKLPEKSARAAAQYLKLLHQQFGCWALALAAYNAGEGLVERAMQDYNLSTFDELSPYLPQETQLYVPRVLAVASVRERG